MVLVLSVHCTVFNHLVRSVHNDLSMGRGEEKNAEVDWEIY